MAFHVQHPPGSYSIRPQDPGRFTATATADNFESALDAAFHLLRHHEQPAEIHDNDRQVGSTLVATLHLDWADQ